MNPGSMRSHPVGPATQRYARSLIWRNCPDAGRTDIGSAWVVQLRGGEMDVPRCWREPPGDHRGGPQWRLRVVEGVGEWVGAGVVDVERGKAEGVLGVGEDAREGGGPGVGVTGLSVGGDNDQRHPRALLGAVGVAPGGHLIVEASAVVPGDEDRGGAPLGPVLRRGYQVSEPVVPGGHG